MEQMSEADLTVACEQCGPPIDLDERGVISLRHARTGDEEDLRSLYEGLDQADLSRRFFTPGVPTRHFLEGWVDIESKGGLCLLADHTAVDGHRQVIAEAGYSALSDGDVELGITVARDHRGWIGAWLLDVLLTHAHVSGIENMQALVKTGNRPMLDIIRHRGCARFDEADWSTTRVTMSTSGHTPSWPPESARPRILIESQRSRPDTARRIRDRSGTTLVCGGYDQRGSHCPLHDGARCPLIEGADAVIIDRRGFEGPDTLPAAIAETHPDATVIEVDQATIDELPARLPPLDVPAEDEGP
jgi:hypothetical protein